MPADLIVYALVAAGLVFWLRSILGTRHGDERQRPPVTLREVGNDVASDLVFSADAGGVSAEEKLAAFSDKAGVMSLDESASAGLLAIGKADRNFDIGVFLNAAQDAFVIIVEAFADGDRETLGNLLGPDVYAAFDGALEARTKIGEIQKSEIHVIKKAEITEARLEGKMAYVTVSFIADETSVTMDKDEKIIAGHPEKITEMKDIWVFGHDTKSKSPSWLVFETRGDFDGDNDLIPDTH